MHITKVWLQGANNKVQKTHNANSNMIDAKHTSCKIFKMLIMQAARCIMHYTKNLPFATRKMYHIQCAMQIAYSIMYNSVCYMQKTAKDCKRLQNAIW